MKPKNRSKQIKHRRKRKHKAHQKPKPQPKPKDPQHPKFTSWWDSGKPKAK